MIDISKFKYLLETEERKKATFDILTTIGILLVLIGITGRQIDLRCLLNFETEDSTNAKG